MTKKVFVRIVEPIINQFPLCVFLFLLWGFDLFVSLFGPLYAYDLKVFLVNIILQPFLFFCGLFFFMYVFASVTDLINKRWFTIFVYGIILLLAGIKWFLHINFGIDITPTTLVLLVETNKSETLEFIQSFVITKTNLFLFLVLIGIIVFICICEIKYRQKNYNRLKEKQHLSLFFSCIILAMFIYSCYNAYVNCSDLVKCNDTDDLSEYQLNTSIKNPLTEVIYSFYGVYLMNKEEISFEEMVHDFDPNDVVVSGDDSLNIVLVIGESFIKHHSNLYGYSLITNPNLSKEQKSGNLFVFNNVITPYPYTSITIKNVLCTNSLSDGEKWNKSLFFPLLFKSAGYDVYLWDNQKNLIENSVWAFALNSFLYNSLLVNRLYTKTNEQSYSFDEDIVESFSSMELPVKRNFVIFHLMGQHVEFKERYPHTKEFLFFTKDSINRHESWMTDEKRQMIADYDNATRYNDYVMSKIFNLFRDKKSIVVYFPDHGEEVYDYRDSYGRKDDGMSHNQIKYLHEVPFVIWCSDSYCREQPETIKRLRAALHRPFMIDNICQLLFHLGGVKTKYYYSDRDLISTEFKPRKRIIVDKYDYDKVMQDEIKTKR